MNYTDMPLSELRWKLGLIHWACHRLNIDPDSVLDAWVAAHGGGKDPDPELVVTIYVAWLDGQERKVSHFNSKEGEAAASVKVFAERRDKEES